MNSIKEENCNSYNTRPSSQSMQVNYSNVSTYSSATSSLSISPLMQINTNQLYLATNSSSSSSPSSSASSTSSMSPLHSNPMTNNSNNNNNNQYGSNTSDQYLDMSMSDEGNNMYNSSQLNMSINNNPLPSASSSSSDNSNKVNRFFADGVVDILNKWFVENQSYPYPDENMTNILAKEANISAKQVRKWFANKRVRSNKCCKQSVKVKRESKNRRQTKSVSEADNFLTFNMTDSDEFNTTYNEENLNESVNHRQSYNNNNIRNNNKRNSYCLNNTSSSVFMDSSSPLYTNDYNTRQFNISNNNNNNTNNESIYECFEDENRNNSNKKQQELQDSYIYNFIQQNNSEQQQINNASLLCNNLLNSAETSNRLAANLAAAISIYTNPLVIQLLQNQTLQTALANQIINNSNNNNNNIKESNTSDKFTFKSTYNKRKTHLTNIYDRETSELSIDLSATSTKRGGSDDDMSFHNQTKSTNSSTSSSVDSEEFNTTPTSSSSSSSYSSPSTMFEQFKSEPIITTNNNNTSKPTRRINFGDISDLIN